MRKEEVIEKVIEVIAESTGMEAHLIRPDSTLFNELPVNSIDIVDILYSLEMEYDISLKLSDLEKQSRDAMNGKPFEIDNVVTDEGLKVLAEKMPEIPASKMVKGLTVNDIMKLITVESLANMVIYKLNSTEAEV
jgi:acyl carrier protein